MLNSDLRSNNEVCVDFSISNRVIVYGLVSYNGGILMEDFIKQFLSPQSQEMGDNILNLGMKIFDKISGKVKHPEVKNVIADIRAALEGIAELRKEIVLEDGKVLVLEKEVKE
jgi:hypothetical protein